MPVPPSRSRRMTSSSTWARSPTISTGSGNGNVRMSSMLISGCRAWRRSTPRSGTASRRCSHTTPWELTSGASRVLPTRVRTNASTSNEGCRGAWTTSSLQRRAERETLIGFGARSGQISVIPCGVDVSRFRPVPSAPRPGRRILCISRLVPRKGIADVVRAVVSVPDVELIIAGGPPQALLGDGFLRL